MSNRPPVNKAKNFSGTLKKLFAYISESKIKMFAVLFFSIIGTTLTIAGPNIMRRATNKLFEGIMEKARGVPGAAIDFDYIGKVLLIMLGFYLASILFSVVQSFILAELAQSVSYKLRKQISDKINRLPMRYFDSTQLGDVLSRITNDVDAVSQSLNQNLSQALSSIVTLVGVLIMMLSISVRMTLVTLIVIPVSGAILSFTIKRSQKYFIAQQRLLGVVNANVEEHYTGHNVIKSFNQEGQTLTKLEGLTSELYDSSWRSQFFSGVMMPIMGFVGNLGYVAVTIAGGFFTIRKVIQVGDILAFLQYVRMFTQPISQLSQIVNNLQSTVAAAERVFEFLEADEEVRDASGEFELDKIKGNVKFENVSFGYDENNLVIKDFNLSVEAGQKIAIVGPTGSGKTTIVKLLERFYELDQGDIYVEGNNITDFSRSSLRSLYGMVQQDPWLYNTSIRENIRFGNLSATDEEVEHAAVTANADHFIRTLPGGYDMVINEEANNISEGQKQLLTIARAILSDPKILILDESTSSVDTRTEQLLQSAMDKLMSGRTSFIIAHRLSTIKNADLIVVMDQGRIVEKGNHDELMKKEGFYFNLYSSQFEE